MADHDMDPGDEMDRTEWSERAVGHAAQGGSRPGFTASLPMTTADMLSVLTTAPLEYSYFDHGKLGAWAGPKHWKFKPMSKVVREGEEEERGCAAGLRPVRREGGQGGAAGVVGQAGVADDSSKEECEASGQDHERLEQREEHTARGLALLRARAGEAEDRGQDGGAGREEGA